MTRTKLAPAATSLGIGVFGGALLGAAYGKVGLGVFIGVVFACAFALSRIGRGPRA